MTGELRAARQKVVLVELPAAELVDHGLGRAIRTQINDLLDLGVAQEQLDRAAQLVLSLSSGTDDTDAHVGVALDVLAGGGDDLAPSIKIGFRDGEGKQGPKRRVRPQ